MPSCNIEICAANLASALNAQSGGASRIELCTGLTVGGLTPSHGLIRVAVEQLSIGVHVLIRPREGNFTYSAGEIDLMLRDIEHCAALGADGVVVGVANERGELDAGVLADMKAVAGDMQITSHRVFDFTPDPYEALETLVDLGFHRILSSGQAPSAAEGSALLGKLVERSAGRIEIMPGSGIWPHNILAVAQATGASSFHLSAKKRTHLGAANAFSGLDPDYDVSDPEVVRACLRALEG